MASFTYAATGLLHAAIDAARQLRSKDKVAAGQIGRIDIDMPKPTTGTADGRQCTRCIRSAPR